MHDIKKKKTLSNKNYDYNEAHFCFIGPPLASFFNTKLAIKARSLWFTDDLYKSILLKHLQP